jgi:hypothetical protein
VFGAPVALAARCAGVAPDPDAGPLGLSMVFRAAEWGHRDFGEVFPPKKYKLPDGTIHEQPIGWELVDPRTVEMKNIGATEVRQIVNRGIHLPWQSADERAREGLAEFKRARVRAAVEVARRVGAQVRGLTPSRKGESPSLAMNLGPRFLTCARLGDAALQDGVFDLKAP